MSTINNHIVLKKYSFTNTLNRSLVVRGLSFQWLSICVLITAGNLLCTRNSLLITFLTFFWNQFKILEWISLSWTWINQNIVCSLNLNICSSLKLNKNSVVKYIYIENNIGFAVLWFRGFTGFVLSLVSWFPLFHGFMSFCGFTCSMVSLLPWISWF